MHKFENGTVRAANAAAKTLTLESGNVFNMAPDYDAAAWKPGDKVKVAYEDRDGGWHDATVTKTEIHQSTTGKRTMDPKYPDNRTDNRTEAEKNAQKPAHWPKDAPFDPNNPTKYDHLRNNPADGQPGQPGQPGWTPPKP